MSLIKLRCKVKLFTEEEMELLDKGLDLPEVTGRWLVRDEVFRVSEIYKITRHSSSKTLITTYDGEKFLVMEPFIDVYNKWLELEKKLFTEPSDSETTESEKIEENSEDTEEED